MAAVLISILEEEFLRRRGRGLHSISSDIQFCCDLNSPDYSSPSHITFRSSASLMFMVDKEKVVMDPADR